MNNRTIAHEWANQVRESRRGSNFYYEGPRLYSYGSHFVVGMYIPAGKAARSCYLLNSRSYSVSTSRHQGYARGAISSGALVFNVPNPDTGFSAERDNCADYLKRINAAQELLMRTRKYPEEREGALRRVIAEAAAYVAYFNVKGSPKREIAKWEKRAAAPNGLISEKDRAALAKRMAAERERTKAAEAARAARQAEAAKEAAAQMEKWVAGVPDVRPPSYYNPTGAALPTRLRIKGAAVETSRGAVVSCRAALVVWKMVKAGRDIVGVVLDGYTITAFNGVLKIGCHTIERAEVERIGAMLEARKAEAGEMDSTNV